MKRIGLCMIVKNESKVILRCLESVRPIVDYVLIEDTGSTDATQEIIRQWIKRVGVTGEVYDEPWRDFAYNRSHVLARLRQQKQLDYALILDADDYIVLEPDFDVTKLKRQLKADLYKVELRSGPARYDREQICSNKREFLYRGVLHEFIDTADGGRSWKEPKVTIGRVNGFYIVSTREGARSDSPDKYLTDAVLLEQALATEQDPFLRSRYTFYLARSYNDAGEKQKALKYFLKRAELGYWHDEVFVSLYSAGLLQHALGHPLDEVMATFTRASAAAPNRAEALWAASQICRESERFAEGYEYAKRGLAITAPPADALFVLGWIYDYGLLDEFAVNAYWTERYQDCLDACERLLREGKMPANMHDRVKKNAEFAAIKIGLQSDGPRTIHESIVKAKSARMIETDFLFDLLKPERLTTIVDIGANPIDSMPPYKALLDQRRCRVIGFEPQPDALAALNAQKSDLETYLPDVVGDGNTGLLRVCRASGMTSLFPPNAHVLQYFPGFSEWGHVVETIPVRTRRLDDITEIASIDFLSMDVQGSELSIIINGHERLKAAVAVQTEVSFVPLYEGQPSFAYIDIELRRLGFLPHCFAAIKTKLIAPLPPKTIHEGINQLLEADILYTRDFTKADQMTPEQLKHLAIVAHHCYRSFDLTASCLNQLVRFNAAPADAVQQYIAALEEAGMR